MIQKREEVEGGKEREIGRGGRREGRRKAWKEGREKVFSVPVWEYCRIYVPWLETSQAH